MSEYSLDGSVVAHVRRRCAPTGQEQDRDVHLALNTGLPIVNPQGGFYFVFLGGVPMFRKYDAAGALLFERHIEGPELDAYMRELPTSWPRRRTDEGELPIVQPAVRAAAADAGRQPVDVAGGAVHLRLRRQRRQAAHDPVPGRRARSRRARSSSRATGGCWSRPAAMRFRPQAVTIAAREDVARPVTPGWCGPGRDRRHAPTSTLRIRAEHPLDLGDQGIGQAGLGHERVAAGLPRPFGVAGQRVPGQRDDGNVLGSARRA